MKSPAAPKAPAFGMGALQQRLTLPVTSPKAEIAAGALVPKKTQQDTGIRSPEKKETSAVVEHVAASRYEAQMWKAVSEFQQSLRSLRGPKSDCFLDNKAASTEFESNVEEVVTGSEKIRSDSMLMDEQVREFKRKAILLLGKRDDIERQIRESRRLIDEQRGERIDADGNLAKDQPLDAESEKTRHSIAAKAVLAQKAHRDMQERVRLVEKLFDVTVEKRSSQSFLDRIGRSGYSPPRRSRKEDAAMEANKALFDALKKSFERTGHVEASLKQLRGKINELRDNKGTSLSGKTQTPKAVGSGQRTPGNRRARIAPLPLKFASPLASKKQSAQVPPPDPKEISRYHSSVENAVRTLRESVPVKKFSRRHLVVTNSRRPRGSEGVTNWRSRGRSQLMRSDVISQATSRGTGFQSPPTSASKRSLFALPPSGTRQAEWDVVSTEDQAKLDAFSLQLPTKVKLIDASKAAREALVPYGTTPEKSAEARATKVRGGTVLRQPQKTPEVPKITRPPPAPKTPSAAFPPMSVKAPTPLSEKGISSTKAKINAAFPPMATKAPTPFGQSAPKPKSEKTAPAQTSAISQKQEATATSGTKSKTPSSLFGLPPSKSEDKKLPAIPATETSKVKPGSAPSPFGGFGGLADALSDSKSAAPSNEKPPVAAPGPSGLFGTPKINVAPNAGAAASPFAAAPNGGEQDYHKVLTEFYQKYNPAKVPEVAKHLQKYKGREPEMFEKLARKYSVANPLSDAAKGISTPAPSPSDYHSILAEFYKQHNPAKVPEVAKHLERFKGREPAMFAKLASKYNAPNPLQGASKPAEPKAESSSMSLGGMGSSLFGSNSAPSASGAVPSPSPFGAPAAGPAPAPSLASAPTPLASPSPFGGASAPGPAAAPSPFGSNTAATSQSPFGAPKAAAPSPFGQQAGAPSTPFGAAPSTTPFGQASVPAPSPSPFGAAAPAPAPPSSSAFGGKNPRDILVDFYQKRNPSKVGEVDKLLAKYAGQEEQLFRNLAKKYSLDPALFGVSAMPAAAPAPSPFGAQPGGMASSSAGFGHTSTLGGIGGGVPTSPTPFGNPSALGGCTSAPAFGSPAGGGGFGSSAGPGTTPGFGGLAAAGGSSGFGAAPAGGSSYGNQTGGFGSTAGGGFGASGATGGFGAPAPGAAAGGFGTMGGGSGGFGSSGGFGGGMAAASPFGSARR